MLKDEITITAKAGKGGNGVTRWRHEKFQPMGGPAGGNGGKGGDVYVVAVLDLNQLSKYTGDKHFEADSGEAGRNNDEWGADGEDLYIKVPVGSIVTDIQRERKVEVMNVGDKVKILSGGKGGYGNIHFKSSTNRSPEESTDGREGEEGEFLIELALMADIGLVGLPNAGKSSLLNNFTNATSKIGDYPFTTLEPHLGALYEFVIADIPGIIEGASSGKGLGHKFLRHISRTKMFLHLVSLENEDPISVYKSIRKELEEFSTELTEKEEWIILTKTDLVDSHIIEEVKKEFDKLEKRVFITSVISGEGTKELRDSLVKALREG